MRVSSWRPAAPAALAQQKTEITLARFFGACDADYGTNTDLTKARGECGMITTLVNVFNATNKDGIVVKPQIIEWGPYYQQLTARLAARDVPNIAVMHTVSARRLRAHRSSPSTSTSRPPASTVADFTPNAKAGVTVGGKIHGRAVGHAIPGSGTSTSGCSRRPDSSTRRASRSSRRSSTSFWPRRQRSRRPPASPTSPWARWPPATSATARAASTPCSTRRAGRCSRAATSRSRICRRRRPRRRSSSSRRSPRPGTSPRASTGRRRSAPSSTATPP